jgi:hypothetical protein
MSPSKMMEGFLGDEWRERNVFLAQSNLRILKMKKKGAPSGVMELPRNRRVFNPQREDRTDWRCF